MSKRSKACDIPKEVRIEVYQRDKGCIICGSTSNPKKINSDNGFGGRCPVCGYYIVKSIFSSKGHKQMYKQSDRRKAGNAQPGHKSWQEERRNEKTKYYFRPSEKDCG